MVFNRGPYMSPMRRISQETRQATLGIVGWIALGAMAGAGMGVVQHRLGKRGRDFSFAGRSVIITGGSRGLGLAMARKLAKEGARLALLARTEDDLRQAEDGLGQLGADVLALPCDVRDRQQVEWAVNRVAARFGGIDVLINNAGIIQVGPLKHMTLDDFEQAMGVHFYGPLFLTLAVLPWMRQAGGGRIVNISSIGGKVAAPHLVPYSASKHALTGLSDGLRAELSEENVLVTTVCPGLMRTGSPPNAQFKGRHRQEYAWFTVSDSLPLLSMSAERAAGKIIRACRRGSPGLILGIPARAAILLSEVLPGATARMASLVQRVLPATDPGGSNASRTGWESESSGAPSLLTRPTYEAAARNNER